MSASLGHVTDEATPQKVSYHLSVKRDTSHPVLDPTNPSDSPSCHKGRLFLAAAGIYSCNADLPAQIQNEMVDSQRTCESQPHGGARVRRVRPRSSPRKTMLRKPSPQRVSDTLEFTSFKVLLRCGKTD